MLRRLPFTDLHTGAGVNPAPFLVEEVDPAGNALGKIHRGTEAAMAAARRIVEAHECPGRLILIGNPPFEGRYHWRLDDGYTIIMRKVSER